MERWALLTLLALLVANCGTEPPKRAPGLLLPDGSARLRIQQRTSAAVPGSAGLLHVHLGDITRGQVAVTLRHADGSAVLATTSLEEGAMQAFPFDGHRYRVTVVDLENRLIGQDFAVLEFGTGPSQRERIEALLAAVERSGATFIRNGKEHSGAEAVKHLRRKWKHAPADLSAEQFIDEIASRSSTTGRVYRIKPAEGDPVDAAVWFRERLEHAR